MRRNYEEERASALEEEKVNPVQAVIGLVVLFLVVVIFCFASWRITHADRSGTVAGQNTENTQDSIADWDGQTLTPETVESSVAESSQPQESVEPENALGMVFEPVEEFVTAKDVTNLRSEPSTDQGQLTVVTQLSNGQNALRTGINADTGWSRLEYNGEVVYAVSQYLVTVEVE